MTLTMILSAYKLGFGVGVALTGLMMGFICSFGTIYGLALTVIKAWNWKKK